MAELVMVHGIGPEDETEEQLRTDWVRALTRTLRENGRQEQADRLHEGSTSVAMAHYRSLFAPYVPQDDWDMPFPEQMALTSEAVGENIMDNIHRHASDPLDSAEAARELSELRTEIGPEQGPYAPVRLVVAMLGRLGPIARSGFAALSSTGVFHLGQVAAYLDDESVREGAIESVLSRVTGDTKAVIAHSLGTVVAYEALHRLDRPLPLLVTFGSPLGLRSVIRERLRPQPLRTPDQLKRWVNIADRDDYIVSTLRLRTLFPETDDVLERTHMVKNANGNPHAALEYLKHWETVAPLAQVL
ncbi:MULTISPECIES: hypothetical protein [Streptomyces]|uniref:hypothetical protein n=1 Tax=Streptomyces TaxID=1883 RepID=UPI002AC32D53|nr:MULTISPECIES: hypothetical protein [Streptomyces]MEE1805556.1 hypothetical protein [Streptomyces sp. BE133]WPW32215.1 hypothetical protein P6B95_35755 [Streptomyces atratus]